MPIPSKQRWDAIDRIYNEGGAADKIALAAFAKLIEFKMAMLNAAGLPQLTATAGSALSLWNRQRRGA